MYNLPATRLYTSLCGLVKVYHKEVFLVGEEENLSEAGRPVREESHHQRQARRFSGKDGEGNSTEDGGLPAKS